MNPHTPHHFTLTLHTPHHFPLTLTLHLATSPHLTSPHLTTSPHHFTFMLHTYIRIYYEELDIDILSINVCMSVVSVYTIQDIFFILSDVK